MYGFLIVPSGSNLLVDAGAIFSSVVESLGLGAGYITTPVPGTDQRRLVLFTERVQEGVQYIFHLNVPATESSTGTQIFLSLSMSAS